MDKWFSMRGLAAAPLPGMIVIVLALGAFNLSYAEIVPAGGGFGWDGVTYADMARRLEFLIRDGQLSRYFAQRILPSLTVRAMLTVSAADLSDQNIIYGFKVLNILSLVFGVIVWRRIADRLSIGPTGSWIGFASLFLNYFGTKHLMYAPVTTDAAALLVNLLLLLSYLERRAFWLFAVTIAGSFVWQLTGIYGAILLVSLGLRLDDAEIDPAQAPAAFDWQKARQRLSPYRRTVAIVAAAVCAILLLLLLTPFRNLVTYYLALFLTGAPAMAAVLLALWILVCPLLRHRSPLAIVRQVPFHLVLLAVGAWLIPQIVFRWLSNPDIPNASGMLQVLACVILPFGSRGMFFLAFLAASLLWGPAVLLVMLRWREVSREVRRLGPGPVGVVAMTLPLVLATEARFALGAWPILVVALVLVLDKSGVSKFLAWLFAALTLANAQFWLTFNIAPWDGNDFANLRDFPKQMFFLHYGPWMSWPAYLVQLPLVLLAGWLLWMTMRPSQAPSRDAPRRAGAP